MCFGLPAHDVLSLTVPVSTMIILSDRSSFMFGKCTLAVTLLIALGNERSFYLFVPVGLLNGKS